MNESIDLTYRPDASWTDLERGTWRIDLLALAVTFLSSAIVLAAMLA